MIKRIFIILCSCLISCSYQEQKETRFEKKELVLPSCSCSTSVDLYTPDTPIGSVFNVDSYGAIGDGVTDDSTAIQNAINAASTNNTITFTSNKTYKVCKQIAGLSGQFWTSSSTLPATIKRCNEVKSALTSTVTTSTTVFTVSSSSGFQIGQQVTFVNNVTTPGHDDGDIQTNWVTAINGNQITVSKAPLVQFDIGDFLVTNFPMSSVTGNAKVTRLIFDGNKTNNNFYIAWEYQQSLVVLNASNALIQRNIFLNGQGESVYLNSGSNMEASNNLFMDSNGSGLHLSGLTSPLLTTNTFLRTNLQADRTQHSEAAITWSFNNLNVEAISNCFQDTEKYAMGRIVLATGNQGAFISSNTICNTEGILDVKGGAASYPSDGLPANVVFEDNFSINSKKINLYEYTGKMRSIDVSFNEIWNGYLYTMGVDDLTVDNNTFNMLDTSYDDGLGTEDTTGSIGIVASNDVMVYNNQVNQGRRGILISSYTPLAFSDIRNISVLNNTIQDQTISALTIGARSFSWYENGGSWQTNYADLQDVYVGFNTLKSSSLNDPNSNFNSLVHLGKGLAYHGPVFDNNCLVSSKYGVFLEGHTGTFSTKASMTRNNIIISTYDNFRSWTGTYDKDLVIRNNLLNKTIPSRYTNQQTNQILFNTIDTSLTDCEL